METNRMDNKRKKHKVKAGQSKKRKLDPLVDWGEAKVELDGQEELPMSWFTSSLEEGDTVSPTGLGWGSKPDIMVGRKLKQLELNFSKVLDTTLLYY